jgi:heme exporter protein A
VDLACERGGRLLFRGLSFALQPGQVVWLRGRNGRGKSSLLRLLAGLSTPLEGAITCDGVPLRHAPPAWRERLLFIAHANALKEDLTVMESLRFLAQIQGRDCSAGDLREALSCLGVAALAQRPVRTLSQGQRRRVALSRLALPQPPSVWLLDEPFDALDNDGIGQLNGLLSAHARAGGSSLLTSHQAVTLADPVPTVLDLDAVVADANSAQALI